MSERTVYLVQTDTTVGFASKSAEALAFIKKRDTKKPFLKTVAGLRELKKLVRIPSSNKKTVRRARRTTFVYPPNDTAIRVVFVEQYFEFLKPFGWLYSTSANISGEDFDEEFARSMADVVIETDGGFVQKASSKIIKLGKKQKKLR